MPRGRRLNVRAERSASDRALDMLPARLGGAAPATEVPLLRYDRVPPPPAVVDLRRARMALVSEGGLVPRGNPDRLEWVRATRWLAYSLAGVDDLAGIEHDVIHGG